MLKDLEKQEKTIAAAGTTFSDEIDLGDLGANNLETTLNVTSHNEGDTTLDVTPQYQYGDDIWFDNTTAFSQKTAVGSESLKIDFTAVKTRFKFVVAGTSPNVTFDLYAVGKS